MAIPEVTLTPDKQSYFPGDPIVVGVDVRDADTTPEVLVVEGHDGQGNEARVTTEIFRKDTFTITRAYWERTGTNLTVSGMSVSGTVPSA